MVTNQPGIVPFRLAAEPGVYILESSGVSPGLSGPACLLPESTSVSMDLSASGTCAVDVSSSAGVHCAQDSSAAVEVISLVDSPKRVFDGSNQQFYRQRCCRSDSYTRSSSGFSHPT